MCSAERSKRLGSATWPFGEDPDKIDGSAKFLRPFRSLAPQKGLRKAYGGQAGPAPRCFTFHFSPFAPPSSFTTPPLRMTFLPYGFGAVSG
jgi:hypothetical protein